MADGKAYGASGQTQPGEVPDLALHVAARSILVGSEPPKQVDFCSPMNASA
jgi:hypothetical protein